jgi:hypothetical protein
VRLVPNGGLGDENRGVYRAITREDDNSSSLCSDFPEPPNRSTFRRRLRFWSRMERKAISELHGPAISTRVLTVTASTRRPQLCALLRGGHIERHSRFRELLRHRGNPPPISSRKASMSRRIAVSKSRSLEPWNFIVDGLANGRMVRILSVVEVPKREYLALGGGRGARAARHAD